MTNDGLSNNSMRVFAGVQRDLHHCHWVIVAAKTDSEFSKKGLCEFNEGVWVKLELLIYIIEYTLCIFLGVAVCRYRRHSCMVQRTKEVAVGL